MKEEVELITNVLIAIFVKDGTIATLHGMDKVYYEGKNKIEFIYTIVDKGPGLMDHQLYCKKRVIEVQIV